MFKNEKGVTLIELLIVIVILGLIAVVAVPLVGRSLSNSKQDLFITDVNTLQSATQLYCTNASSADFNKYCTVDSTDPITKEMLLPYISISVDYNFVIDGRNFETRDYRIYIYNDDYLYVGYIKELIRDNILNVPSSVTLPTTNTTEWEN